MEIMSPASNESLREDILEIKSDVKAMQKSIMAIAVQDERLRHLETNVDAMWAKFDGMRNELDPIIKWQAGCPRDQVRWVWWVIIPQSMVLIGLLAKILLLMEHHP